MGGFALPHPPDIHVPRFGFPSICRRLIFALLSLQSFDFLAAAVYLTLLLLTSRSLRIAHVRLAPPPSAAQSTRRHSTATANRVAYAVTTYARSSEPARRCSAEGGDGGSV